MNLTFVDFEIEDDIVLPEDEWLWFRISTDISEGCYYRLVKIKQGVVFDEWGGIEAESLEEYFERHEVISWAFTETQWHLRKDETPNEYSDLLLCLDNGNEDLGYWNGNEYVDTLGIKYEQSAQPFAWMYIPEPPPKKSPLSNDVLNHLHEIVDKIKEDPVLCEEIKRLLSE